MLGSGDTKMEEDQSCLRCAHSWLKETCPRAGARWIEGGQLNKDRKGRVQEPGERRHVSMGAGRVHGKEDGCSSPSWKW